MKRSNDYLAKMKMRYDILNFIKEAEGPVGAITLSVNFSEKHNISQASLGRELKLLDHEGFTMKITKVGRVITPEGAEHIKFLHDLIILEESKDEFYKALLVSQGNQLQEFLIIKRGLEKEAAYLAAINASDEIIERMQKILNEQLIEVRQNRIGLKQDYEFHNLVSIASGNNVLIKTISLMRDRINLLRKYTSTRHVIGGLLYEDHVRIFNGIKNRDPHEAARAMGDHIGKWIDAIDRGKPNIGGEGEGTI